MPPETLVEAFNLGFTYPCPMTRALAGVSFELPRGSFTAVMGPNGSGKSTLVRLILGLLRPSEGCLHILGRTPWDNREATQRLIGYVPQHDTVNHRLPVRSREVVWMAAATRWENGGGRAGLAKRVRAALEMVNLGDEAEHPFGSLSGGQRQRVLLARALAVDPHLLVLDEPFAGVDAAQRGDLAPLLSRLAHEKQVTVLVVVHDINPLAHYIDKVLLLSGRMVGFGRPEETLTSELLEAAYGAAVPVLRCDDGVLHPLTHTIHE